MSHKSVKYQSHSVVITIPTDNPAATHSLLLKGINEAIQYYVSNPEKRTDNDALITLLQLQHALLPGEGELAKAFE